MSKKSYEQTCNNTLTRTRHVIDNVRANIGFSYWNKVHFEGDKIPFKGSNGKEDLTLVVISNEMYETRRRLVS